MLSEFFPAFASLISVSPVNAADTAGRLAQCGFSSLGFLVPFAKRGADGDLRRIWREEIKNFSGSGLLAGAERDMLLSFSDCFGMTSLERFSSACGKYGAYFADRSEKEKENAEKNGRLTLGTGVLAALLIIIVII